jgi:rSAM/selenodomain-associated transferase 2
VPCKRFDDDRLHQRDAADPKSSVVMADHTVSVIIPTWNEAANVAGSIESARSAGVDQVIVVDGNSDDATLSIAQHCGATTMICPTPGRGSQMAMGAARATSDVLLFLHADNWLPPDVKSQLDQAGWPVWGGFRQRINAGGWSFRCLEWGNAARLRWSGRLFGDQGLFVMRNAYDLVGGFAEIPLMEDVDLSRKLMNIARPALLPGPLGVDARRWRQTGVLRQTLRNWRIQLAYHRGVPPETLRKWYSK